MANEKRLIYSGEIYELFYKQVEYGATDLMDAFEDALEDAQTVDAVEVVHAYWYAHHGITICSHCQAMFDADLVMLQIPSTWEMPNYCPNCGAKMDGGNEDA